MPVLACGNQTACQNILRNDKRWLHVLESGGFDLLKNLFIRTAKALLFHHNPSLAAHWVDLWQTGWQRATSGTYGDEGSRMKWRGTAVCNSWRGDQDRISWGKGWKTRTSLIRTLGYTLFLLGCTCWDVRLLLAICSFKEHFIYLSPEGSLTA